MFEIIKKVLTVAVVLFCAKIVWQQYSDDRSYKSWPTAQAHLITAEVAVGSHKRGGRYYVVQTTYEFTVNGKLYQSSINSFGERHYSTHQEALQELEELMSHPIHTAHYHPRTPEKNALGQ